MLYRGRFAPTPSGPLHFGSLVAALASWLDARWHQGEWYLRIDDIDPPRVQPGAADRILSQLEHLGLCWDGPVRYQSDRHAAYDEAIAQLLRDGHAFYCTLTRKQLSALDHCHPGISAAVDPGPDRAIRLAVADSALCFEDRIQGQVCANLQQQGGAFVLKRRDGLVGYQLACALDDADDRITHVVRGSDLLDSTLRQCWLLHCLQRNAPAYAHFPVVTAGREHKLSKSAGDQALDVAHASTLLVHALGCLEIDVEPGLMQASVGDILAWGLAHYDPQRLPRGLSIPLPEALKQKMAPSSP